MDLFLGLTYVKGAFFNYVDKILGFFTTYSSTLTFSTLVDKKSTLLDYLLDVFWPQLPIPIQPM
jgi:hypothetical protein